MKYIPEHQTNDGKAKVIYKGKTSKKTQVFSALDWLARLITHIPNKGEQMVKYYGYYSNKSRGMRKKDEEIQKPNECCIFRTHTDTVFENIRTVISELSGH